MFLLLLWCFQFSAGQLVSEIPALVALNTSCGFRWPGNISEACSDPIFSTHQRAQFGCLTPSGPLFSLYVLRGTCLTLPSEIGLLTNLVVLQIGQLLADSDVGGLPFTVLPTQIGQLTNLQFVQVNLDQLRSLPSEIGQWTQLRSLKVSAAKTLSIRAPLTMLPTTIGMFTQLNILALESLALSYLPSQIGRLTSLQNIKLDCPLAVALPTQIGSLTLLTIWDMKNHQAQLPTQFGQLTRLQELLLVQTQSTTPWALPTTIGLLTSVTKLLLSVNSQLRSLPTEVGSMTSLQELTSFSTNLEAYPTEIGRLTNLRTLDCSGCLLTSLPTQIGQVTNLQQMFLNSNALTDLPEEMATLTALARLQMPYQNFQSFPMVITKLTSLTRLDISDLGAPITLPTQIGKLVSLSHLEVRRLRLTSIPTEIGYTALKKLIVDENLLESLPNELPSLWLITAAGNRFTEVPPVLITMTELATIVFDDNLISTLPEFSFGNTLSRLSFSKNRISRIPPSYMSFNPPPGTPSFLQYDLALGFNQITEIPTQIGTKWMLNLILEGNQIETIPTELGLFTGLVTIRMANNNLTSIPTQLGNLVLIRELDLSSNSIRSLPDELANMGTFYTPADFRGIMSAFLSNNFIEKFELKPTGYGWEKIELANNLLEDWGTLTSLPALQHLKVPGNKLKTIPIFNLSTPLAILDVSNNNISDTNGIFTNLSLSRNVGSALKALYLSNNKLSGSLPRALQDLTQLTLLHLAHNQLTSIVASQFQYGETAGLLERTLDLPPFQLPSGTRCSIPTPPALLSLDLSYNKIVFQTQATDGVTGLYADDYTYLCDSANVIRRTYPIYLSNPLKNLDLSYNLLNDTGVRVTFVFVPYNSTFRFGAAGKVATREGAINLAGNRFSAATDLQSVCHYVGVSFAPISPCITMPQDINECEIGTHGCAANSTCTDGWDPQMSYTCTCDNGFKPDLSRPLPGRPCDDVDECEEGFPCGIGWKCVNTVGSFHCERDYLPLITLAIFFVLLVLSILLYFLARWLLREYQAKYLNQLPDDVSWTWRDAIIHPGSDWLPSGGFLSKEFIRGTPEFSKSDRLFSTLGFANLRIGRLYAVYNEVLVSGFVTTHKVQTQRFKNDERIFFAKNWMKLLDDTCTEREKVYQQFQSTINRYPWNQDAVVILPVVHGTDLAIAERIAKTGFAALSAIDAGYYGKGIYFTSFVLYSFPYVRSRRQPALVISWVLTGNPYPVIEAHDEGKNLMGAALKGGYQSHYVITGRAGRIATPQEWSSHEIYDEIVLDQESQIAPAYIVEIDSSNFNEVHSRWEKGGPDRRDYSWSKKGGQGRKDYQAWDSSPE